MNHLLSRPRKMLLLILIPLWISLACVTLTDNIPVDSQTEIVFGPGDFNLEEPKAGLADLSSYKATLTLVFEGTRDGQPSQWSKTYVMLTTKEPAARQLSLENAGDISNLDAVFMAEVDGAAYERRGENACRATVIDSENLLAEQLEPAGFLTFVIGAEDAGMETVNNVASTHYTFDERALGELGLAKSTGEMWIASDGGYIVKYGLTTEGDKDYFGEGMKGTLTWDYQLTDVNGAIAFKLPDDCPAGMVDAPLLPDESNVLNVPSMLAYDTTSSLTDASAFYQEQIPDLGWTLIGEPAITETTALMEFTQADQTMTVILNTGDTGTEVHILLDSSSRQTVTDDPPSDSQGAAGTLDAPLLPDASNVVNTAGILTYDTASSPADVAAFYQEQLPTLGWQPLGEPDLTDAMALLTYTKGDQTMTVIIMAGASVTTVNIVLEKPQE